MANGFGGIIGKVLRDVAGELPGRVLTGAGLTLVSGAVVTPVVLSALNVAASSFAGIGGATAAIVSMSGLGVAISAVGSAVLTRTYMNAARVGLTKASASQ